MNLGVITNCEIDAYKNFDLSPQTIKKSNTTLELLEIKKWKICLRI